MHPLRRLAPGKRATLLLLALCSFFLIPALSGIFPVTIQYAEAKQPNINDAGEQAARIAEALRRAEAEGRRLRVYGATFPSSFALYVLDPDLLAGWNGPLRDYEKKWIPQQYQNLPVLGGWYGQGMIPDQEVLLGANLDVAFLISAKMFGETEMTLRRLGFPLLLLPGVTLEHDKDMFRNLGKALGVPQRGEALASYAEQSLSKVANMLKDMPESERLRIYMAQDADGLTTSCRGSNRSAIFELAGGVNVNVCPEGNSEMVVHLSFEHIMELDPDVIIVGHPGFMQHVGQDKRWQGLRAVREGRLFKVPYEPFSWLDRPASFMRFIGVQWLASVLHPERCTIDMTAETKTFMRLFFHTDITDDQARDILNP